jgi:hypothetical protein
MPADLPLSIRTAPLGAGVMGLWDERTRTVWLDRDLSEVERRCTLVHELVHAERGDVPCGHASLDARQERRVDREAAWRLVPIDALVAAVRWSSDAREVAAMLDVDLDTLRTAIDGLSAEQRALVDGEPDG